ncbi:MAG: 30S ribosome-binding factor RbfA [Clostridia bacterium]|nr:30S ribosome-binding factor RbfA [Oscillospiraceae bacterium]MBO4931743.1 30S ribosome-binding factor RbfA [Clostridia bacterium]MBO5127424.1 30S ribosome-binding factor RbfA [Clostridia bacterium]MBO5258269.1 30S ribosome-binding factor RbfA [Clostridia bacterium]MBP3294258.1 30S ribosome-binding factor RbfA [Clostridia bacterium]
MAKYRKNRINDAMTAECAQIVREIKDPRVSGVMITVMNSDVSADLKFAKIYYSVFGECDEKELARGLKSAVPFVRSQLAQRLNLRITPELTFVRDEGVKHGAEISRLLHEIAKDAPAAQDVEEEEDDDE